MSSYPPPSRPPLPLNWKQQRTQQRNQWRAQRDLYRAQRRGSIVGPLLVIGIGVIFLLLQTRRLSSVLFWSWYGRWWPTLLVGFGVILLLEWALDRWLTHRRLLEDPDPATPFLGTPRRVLGGGVIFLLLLLIAGGIASSAVGNGSHSDLFAKSFNLNQDNLDEFLGDKHESDETLAHTIAANASITINNPHGDVFVSGTSPDGQLHLTVHKQVFSRSDEDANHKEVELAPHFDGTDSSLSVTVPSVDGSRADITLMIPGASAIAITANHGDVHVNSLKAALSLTSNHGDTEISDITGGIATHSNSNSGSTSAHNVTGSLAVEGRGHDLTISDVSGTVSINGDFFGTTHLERIRGAVKFHTSRTELQFASLVGEVEISPDSGLTVARAAGPLSLNTRNRNITLDHVSGDCSVTNHNGSVNLTSALPLGNISVENRNGSVDLTLPNNANFTVQADTSNGDLENEFSLPSGGSENHPSLRGTVGAGGPLVRINTTQGDVSLKRSGAATVLVAPPPPPTAPAPPSIPPEASAAIQEALREADAAKAQGAVSVQEAMKQATAARQDADRQLKAAQLQVKAAREAAAKIQQQVRQQMDQERRAARGHSHASQDPEDPH